MAQCRLACQLRQATRALRTQRDLTSIQNAMPHVPQVPRMQSLSHRPKLVCVCDRAPRLPMSCPRRPSAALRRSAGGPSSKHIASPIASQTVRRPSEMHRDIHATDIGFRVIVVTRMLISVSGLTSAMCWHRRSPENKRICFQQTQCPRTPGFPCAFHKQMEQHQPRGCLIERHQRRRPSASLRVNDVVRRRYQHLKRESIITRDHGRGAHRRR